jgi:hypothetical protein
VEYEGKEIKNMVDFLLGPVRKRPAMYLRYKKISYLESFVTGYMVCEGLNKNSELKEPFFGDKGIGFVEWLEKKNGGQKFSFWSWSFMEKANHDEETALEYFFEALEEFKNDCIPEN